MTKIGLIGGIGPESTISYYRSIVHRVRERLGDHSLPKLSIETLNAFEVFSFCKAEQYDELSDYVVDAINNLAAAGAQYAALTGNTPNVVLDKLKAKSPIPLISSIDATLRVAKQRGLKRVGLLGTVFTMTNTFFQAPFGQAGIEVVIPNVEQIAYIQSKIEAELEHGVVTDETRDGFVKIINAMKQKDGIEQVILGCTELPLLLNDGNSPVPCLDCVDIHVDAIVDRIVRA
jgi:aspartate racemase